MTKETPGPWRTEAVSDAVRVVSGEGRKKVILARLRPPQISEEETAANARLMAAAPTLLEALESVAYWMSDANLPCWFPKDRVLDAIATVRPVHQPQGERKP